MPALQLLKRIKSHATPRRLSLQFCGPFSSYETCGYRAAKDTTNGEEKKKGLPSASSYSAHGFVLLIPNAVMKKYQSLEKGGRRAWHSGRFGAGVRRQLTEGSSKDAGEPGDFLWLRSYKHFTQDFRRRRCACLTMRSNSWDREFLGAHS
jgi:hypothetical protein